MTTLRERIQARIAILRQRATDERTWGGARYEAAKIARELESDLLDSEPPSDPADAILDEVTR